jgi:hypothetical protein
MQSLACFDSSAHPQKPALQEFNHSLVLTAVRHPQQPALQEFNHSLVSTAVRIHKSLHFKNSITRLLRQLAMPPEVAQCAIHKSLHFKNSITRLFRQ